MTHLLAVLAFLTSAVIFLLRALDVSGVKGDAVEWAYFCLAAGLFFMVVGGAAVYAQGFRSSSS